MNPRETALDFVAKAAAVEATDPQTAYRLLASACMQDPTYADGWFKFGNACFLQGLFPAAVAAFRRALDIVPGNIHVLNRLGHTLYHVGELDEAGRRMREVLEQDPQNVHALCNLSMVQSILGTPDESLKLAIDAYACMRSAGENDPAIELQLAFAYLYARRWQAGLKHFRVRFPYAMKRFENSPYPAWSGEDLKGKRLFVLQEMGLGDALSFLRFVPMAAAHAQSVELQVNPELVRVAALALRNHANVSVAPLTQEFPAADYWCSLGDLPTAMYLSDGEIETAPAPEVPYTSIAATVPWKVRGQKLHIGIAWAGNPGNMIDRWRSTTIEQFLELQKVPGVQLYSLQVGERANDLYAAGCVGLVRDLAPYIRDVADTCAILRDLDLVITVESALRHIAGMLGVDCWVPLARNGGDWRCGRQGDSPLWDVHTRLWRQGEDAAWPPVFRGMAAALKERV